MSSNILLQTVDNFFSCPVVLKTVHVTAKAVSDGEILDTLKELACMEGNFVCSHGVANYAAARNILNSLERILQTIEQFQEMNAMHAKDILLQKEIAGKQWKKKDEMKGLKSELAAMDKKFSWSWRKKMSLSRKNRKLLPMVMSFMNCLRKNTTKGLRP